ncbi:MAG: RnfABCDGE type electron transport complex subunit G [Pseudomonadota bacterium]
MSEMVEMRRAAAKGFAVAQERAGEIAMKAGAALRRGGRLARLALRRGRRWFLKGGRDLLQRLAALKGAPAHHGAVLAGFALAAAWLLAASNEGTREAIAARAAEDLQRSLGQVAPAALREGGFEAGSVAFAEGERKVHRAMKDGAVAAVAFETVAQGYAGEIRLLLGVDPSGALLGVRVLSHSETPGLGDKIETSKSDWADGFEGRSLTNPLPEGWAVRKDGGVFDQFSGATVTPRAVIDGIRSGLEFFAERRAELLLLEPSPAPAPAAPQTKAAEP